MQWPAGGVNLWSAVRLLLPLSSRTQDRGPCHQYHTGGTWGSIPHGSGPRASMNRRLPLRRPLRAFRCASDASNHARPPACTCADTVNASYKCAQVRVASPGPAPAAGARPPALVGLLPRPLALPPAVRPRARSSSRAAHARAGTQEGPRSCRRPRVGLWARAVARIRPGRVVPWSPTVPPACRVRSGSATVHIGPRPHAFTVFV